MNRPLLALITLLIPAVVSHAAPRALSSDPRSWVGVSLDALKARVAVGTECNLASPLPSSELVEEGLVFEFTCVKLKGKQFHLLLTHAKQYLDDNKEPRVIVDVLPEPILGRGESFMDSCVTPQMHPVMATVQSAGDNDQFLPIKKAWKVDTSRKKLVPMKPEGTECQNPNWGMGQGTE